MSEEPVTVTGTRVLPWKPLGVFLPGVVSRLPVPQSPITVVAFDVVAMTCGDAAAELALIKYD